MTDKELLEHAAKAAGIEIHPSVEGKDCLAIVDQSGYWGDEHKYWNPLTDDGDALRLAVKLQIDVDNDHPECCVVPEPQTIEYYKDKSDSYAATRRAIVRAAAEIGKGMV